MLISRQGVPASPIATPVLTKRAERMLRALRLTDAELSIMLCDDATIHALNRTHRRKNKPTDVLAFALREGKILPGAEGLLGDVVISLDTARRQAEARGHALLAEVTVLLAHGLSFGGLRPPQRRRGAPHERPRRTSSLRLPTAGPQIRAELWTTGEKLGKDASR